KNFIVGNFETTAKNVSVGRIHLWIGWDPREKTVRSWSFDDSGAFGEGTWTKDGDKWVIKSSVVLQDGKAAATTLVLAPVDANTISLQVKDRILDKNTVADVKEVKLKQVD